MPLKIIRYLLVMCLFSISFSLKAAEEVQVCAKHEVQYGWSKGYKVSALFLDGFELNQMTNRLNYKGYKSYIVIFWDDGQASIIEMPFHFLSVLDQQGEDQRGVKWKISQSAICS